MYSVLRNSEDFVNRISGGVGGWGYYSFFQLILFIHFISPLSVTTHSTCAYAFSLVQFTISYYITLLSIDMRTISPLSLLYHLTKYRQAHHFASVLTCAPFRLCLYYITLLSTDMRTISPLSRHAHLIASVFVILRRCLLRRCIFEAMYFEAMSFDPITRGLCSKGTGSIGSYGFTIQPRRVFSTGPLGC